MLPSEVQTVDTLRKLPQADCDPVTVEIMLGPLHGSAAEPSAKSRSPEGQRSLQLPSRRCETAIAALTCPDAAEDSAGGRGFLYFNGSAADNDCIVADTHHAGGAL